ncbi:conjugal transfer protein [Streptomyces niveus]|uniref:conjugal transfer protein n=1 Tax=Streptomyces niveus TaxID=193462 RepID=UPI0036DEEFA8
MSDNKLTGGQIAVLVAASLPMVAAGGLGGWGTYTNIAAEFGRAATAIGVVAAGEGVTLVLALVMVATTMLGQAAPAPVRVGLWLAPIAAAAVGIVVADDVTEQVVYGMTPLAMSAAAEGLGLLARRIVIYRTGVDMEVQRRNATTMQRLAYHQARAANHPGEWTRNRSERASWRLAARVGEDDAQLGASLVGVQRDRLTEGADAAMVGMFTVAPTVAETVTVAPSKHSATEVLRRRFAEMDPADAIRVAADARPDATPVELADVLGAYGLAVDPVAVALVLGEQPPEYEVHRPDAADAPKVSELEPVDMAGAVAEAASTLGDRASPREIADHIAENRRLVVTEPYIRTALSRAAKKPQADAPAKPMEGGYA